MITVTIRKTAERKGIPNAYQLAKQTGLTQSLAARLWKGESYPLVETLDTLCGKWRCKLTDLIQWTPDTEVHQPAKVNGTSKRIVKKTKERRAR